MEQPGDGSKPRRQTIYEAALPMRTVSLNNAREHWAVRNRRSKQERLAVSISLREMPSEFVLTKDPITITLTRYGKRLLDDDNLAGSFKSIRDEVARQLDRDDNPTSGLRWVYRQWKANEYSIHIRITL